MKQFLINPVLNKEFKLRFRSVKTYIGLLSYLLAIGLIVVGFIFIMTGFGRNGYFRPDESRQLFMMLSFLQLALILFITPGLTAGVISGERERQTLNILLTTIQSSSSIVISKLVSSFSYLLLLIIASLPLYSIVFLFGGVSPVTLITVFGFYLFTIITFASFGVLFSILIRRTVISMVTTYGVTMLLAGGTAFLFMIIMNFTQMQSQQGHNPASYIMAMLNTPIVLASIFMPEIHEEIAKISGINTPLWVGHIVFYTLAIILTLILSIRKLRPNMNRTK